MILGYLLLVLVPIAAIAYIVWDHKRKTAERDAASAGKLQELLAVAPQQRASAATPAGAASVASAPAAQPHATPSLYAVRERVLTPPQTLLYYLLRTGLPEHVVFARVSLASVLEAGPGLSGFAREEQTRKLAAVTVDFVVSDRNLKPVAVVDLVARDPGSIAQGDRDWTRSRLAAAGVRYLELEATQLPRKDAIGSVVLGDAPSGDSARATAEG